MNSDLYVYVIGIVFKIQKKQLPENKAYALDDN